jgi:AAA family ATPase
MPGKSAVNLNTPPSKLKRASTPSKDDSPKKTGSDEDMSFIVRPASSQSFQSAMKVYINLDVLRRLGFSAGNLIVVSKKGDRGVVGIATPSGSKIATEIIEISCLFRQLLGIVAGERVSVVKYNQRPDTALNIMIGCISSDSEVLKSHVIDAMLDFGIVSPGMRFCLSSTGDDQIHDCVIADIQGMSDIERLTLDDDDSSRKRLLSPIYYFEPESTTIEFSNSMVVNSDVPHHIGYSSLGGLSKQIALLRSKIELPLHRPELFKRFNMSPDRGFLLYGPPGTGKTMLLKAIAHETNAHVLTINGPSIVSKYLGETESTLRAIFQEAKDYEPAIIFIDEIDALVPKRDSDDSGEAESRVVSTLLTLMDGMGASGRVVVVGATNRVNSIDPALRRPGRFGQEIEIAIPDSDARLDILRIHFSGMPHQLADQDIIDVANKCHGYVGADLYALCRDAAMRAIQRAIERRQDVNDMVLTNDDVYKAMVDIRPSAMREIVLETPKVYWEDIGGQEIVKQKLKETIEWPLSHPETFSRLGITPPKGVLLYGPPGCSKTLIAKALATEAGLNFLAVKGPELFNKFVGESERAVREVFRKARAAAPSIIFFDEIDALSAARGHGEAGGDRVLTSLLNEMDGIEALKDVTILAATNLPDTIDSALMRPGRLDRLIYVGPPDLDARRNILDIQFRRMQIGADVSVDQLAEQTEGCSGAEVVAVCQEAGLQAMNEDLAIDAVWMRHFNAALKGVRRAITKEVLEYFEEFATAGR